jgi:hypothetical protein
VDGGEALSSSPSGSCSFMVVGGVVLASGDGESDEGTRP